MPDIKKYMHGMALQRTYRCGYESHSASLFLKIYHLVKWFERLSTGEIMYFRTDNGIDFPRIKYGIRKYNFMTVHMVRIILFIIRGIYKLISKKRTIITLMCRALLTIFFAFSVRDRTFKLMDDITFLFLERTIEISLV